MKRLGKIVFFLSVLATLGINTNAQTPANVVLNYERGYFNDNQPLPAETNLLINGGIASGISKVEIDLYAGADKKKKAPLYSANWKRSKGATQNAFLLPFNYKLRGGGEYDFHITYFRNLSDTEREYLRVRLFQTLDAYISSSIQVNRNSLNMTKHYRYIMADLNSIVLDGLADYSNRRDTQFEGFSDVLKSKLLEIEDANLKTGKFLFGGSKNKSAKSAYAQQLVKDLQQLAHNEVEQYLNSELMIPDDLKIIDDYAIAKNPGSLSLNLGYGGVHFDGTFDDLDYGSAPFLGVSLPFGRKAFSPILANTSLSLGVFLTNFENAAGKEVSGPIVKRPTYVGLGYKAFKFVRINAGATFTESQVGSGSGLDLNLSDIDVRPFVGVSVEINLSASLGDK